MGLKVMKYRSDAMGAAFPIAPRPGGGTVVTCRLPKPVVPEGQRP